MYPAALIFVALYNLLFFHTQPGLGTALLFVFLNIYFFTVRDQSNKNILAGVLASVTSVIFAFLFFLRANGVVQIIDITAAIFFSLVALYLYKYQGNLTFKIANFVSWPFRIVFSSIAGFFKLFTADSWPRGLIITLPILAILLLLLTQADPVFNKLTRNFFSGTLERVIQSLAIFLGLLGVGLAALKLQDGPEQEVATDGKSHELIIMTGSVIVLFAVFILVQFQYLFSSVGERDLLKLGIASLTYSEYVRKGFFELLIASSIACGLLLYVLRYLDHLKGRLRVVIRLFSNILTIETGFLLLSAFRRLVLYADAHGLTRARIFGFIFLIWLGILLVILLVRLSKRMKQQWFFTGVAAATLFVLMLVNIINVDGLIATLYKPTVNSEIDYSYLSRLSSDAGESWQPAIEDAKETVSRIEGIVAISSEHRRQLSYRSYALDNLRLKMDYLLHKYGAKDIQWQSFNISEYLAYRKITANLDYYKQIPGLLNQISAIQSRASTEVINNTPLDRSTNSPLTY